MAVISSPGTAAPRAMLFERQASVHAGPGLGGMRPRRARSGASTAAMSTRAALAASRPGAPTPGSARLVLVGGDRELLRARALGDVHDVHGLAEHHRAIPLQAHE